MPIFTSSIKPSIIKRTDLAIAYKIECIAYRRFSGSVLTVNNGQLFSFIEPQSKRRYRASQVFDNQIF